MINFVRGFFKKKNSSKIICGTALMVLYEIPSQKTESTFGKIFILYAKSNSSQVIFKQLVFAKSIASGITCF